MIQSPKVRAAMRAILELNSEELAQFRQMQEEFKEYVRDAAYLPYMHPDREQKLADGIREFKERHDL